MFYKTVLQFCSFTGHFAGGHTLLLYYRLWYTGGIDFVFQQEKWEIQGNGKSAARNQLWSLLKNEYCDPLCLWHAFRQEGGVLVATIWLFFGSANIVCKWKMHKSLHLVNSIGINLLPQRGSLFDLARTTLWQSERETIPWQPLNGKESKKQHMYGFFFCALWTVFNFFNLGFFFGVSAQHSSGRHFCQLLSKVIRWNGWNVMTSEPS